MKQYSVRVSGTVLGDEYTYTRRKDAEDAIRRMERADREYDITYNTKRSIVEREVTAWKTSVGRRKKHDTKKH